MILIDLVTNMIIVLSINSMGEVLHDAFPPLSPPHFAIDKKHRTPEMTKVNYLQLYP
jgi:hypothetical protein